MSSRTLALATGIRSPLVLLIALAFAGAADAQESRPWYVGVSQGFTHDTNVFRSRTGFERGDTTSSTGLLGGLNLNLGRQHLFLDATANANRFQSLKELNNTSYSLNSGLNWQTVEHLSGNVGVTALQNLGQISIPTGAQVKNELKLRQESADVRYGFVSQMGIEAGIQHRRLEYSYTTEQNFTERSGNVGLRWGSPGSVLNFGVAARLTKGDAPLFKALRDPLIPELGFFDVTPDTYDRKDIDFTAIWVPSAISTVNARISLTRENHTAILRPDVSGVTGSVEWAYKPTGRLSLKTSFTRDTGSQTVFTTSVQNLFVPVQANTSQLNNVLSVGANYELTAKIGLSGTVTYNKAPGGGSAITTAVLGAHYDVNRAFGLACNLNNVSYTGYRDTIAGCSAQFVLR